jgi:hypothetical protein
MRYQIAIGNTQIKRGKYIYDVSVLSEEGAIALYSNLPFGEAMYKMASDGWAYQGSHHDMLIWQKREF